MPLTARLGRSSRAGPRPSPSGACRASAARSASSGSPPATVPPASAAPPSVSPGRVARLWTACASPAAYGRVVTSGSLGQAQPAEPWREESRAAWERRAPGARGSGARPDVQSHGPPRSAAPVSCARRTTVRGSPPARRTCPRRAGPRRPSRTPAGGARERRDSAPPPARHRSARRAAPRGSAGSPVRDCRFRARGARGRQSRRRRPRPGEVCARGGRRPSRRRRARPVGEAPGCASVLQARLPPSCSPSGLPAWRLVHAEKTLNLQNIYTDAGPLSRAVGGGAGGPCA